MIGQQKEPVVNSTSVLAAVQALDNTGLTTTALDLGVSKSRDEIVLVHCGPLTDIDKGFIRVQESFNLGTNFTEIGVLPLVADVQQLRIARKQRYLRVVVQIEETAAGTADVTLGVVLLR